MQRKILLLTICFSLASAATCFGSQQPKPLAPGVLKVITPTIDARDTYSLPMPLVGLDSKPFQPNFAPILDTLHGQTQNVVFFRDVWQYEFGFTGLRQAQLPLRTVNGTVNQNVWYMIIRIRNTGVNCHLRKSQRRRAIRTHQEFVKAQRRKLRSKISVQARLLFERLDSRRQWISGSQLS